MVSIYLVPDIFVGIVLVCPKYFALKVHHVSVSHVFWRNEATHLKTSMFLK